MLDWFVNPWSMLAGVLLISSPIIIHLINRIRFKRVKWAAMEFLLKAQKRVRRKMILQQLLLLLLRILAVLLVGFLIARFAGFNLNDQESRATTHIVILDDTPSMADGWRNDDGTPTTSFEQAKKVLLEQIAKSASEATTPQRLEVLRLSQLSVPDVLERLNDAAITKYAGTLNNYQPSNVRVGLVDGLKAAKEILEGQPGDVAKIVHVLSDFRSVDWSENADAIKDVAKELSVSKVKVNLIDVAHPYRKKDDRRSPLAHDNLAITELQPAKLVVARYDPLEFTLKVKNFGASEMKSVRFAVKVNGDENKGRSVAIETLPGNQERTIKFEIPFDRIGSEEKPLDRFNLVTVSLESGEPGGLTADNVRHAVVEVRERLPILVIEGRPNLRETKEGDGFYLRSAISTYTGFAWVNGTVRDLEQADLSKYTFIMLLNVPRLSDAATKNLEEYAKNGGGVGFFLGPDVRSADYNKQLYRDGLGLFPVPLMDQPSKELTEDELQARRFRISQKKLLIRDPARRSHPALAGLYTDERGEPIKDAEQLERVFGFISIKRYWPVMRIGKWRDDPTVSELYCMPNEQSMSEFEQQIRVDLADKLPVDDAEFVKYKDLLTRYREDLRRIAISSEPLYKLGNILDDFLADQRGYGDPNEALLRELWTLPKMADLKSFATRLRDRVKYGDPFYVAKQFGRGRVIVVTTTAGETWSDWPSEKPGSASYSPIIKELGSYLSGAGAEENRTLGNPIELRLEATRYKPIVGRAFLTHTPIAGGAKDPNPAPIVDLKEQQLEADGESLVMRFREAMQPGAYLFTFTNLQPKGNKADAAEAPEYHGYAANLDANREGDLRRASRDDVILTAIGAQLHSVDDSDWVKELRNKKSDLSESWVLVVLLGLLLLAEQYLSMRLSFNNTGDLETTAPTVATTMRKTMTTPTATAA